MPSPHSVSRRVLLSTYFPRDKNSIIYPFKSHSARDSFYHLSLICMPCHVSLSLTLYPFFMCLCCGFSICSNYVEVRVPSSRVRFRHLKGKPISKGAPSHPVCRCPMFWISQQVQIVVPGSFCAQPMTLSNPTKTPPRRTH